MFNEEFFPTPQHVISKMLEPFVNNRIGRPYLTGSYQILEPSAGKGDILKYICDTLKARRENVYAIEPEPELQAIIKDAGFRLIHNDFLSYAGDYHFNLIVMNPPFSNGDEHLLKAWDVLAEGDIVCLLNAETINNPCTRRRELLADIIRQYGTVEMLGQAFRTAQRRTDVEVAMVRLHKPAKDDSRFAFSFEAVTREAELEFNEEVAGDSIALSDMTGAMLRQYSVVKDAFLEYMKAQKRLHFYAQGLLEANTNIVEMANSAMKDNQELPSAYNSFVNTFKASAWRRILRKLNIEKYMTNGVMKNFQKFTAEQGQLDLTRENIHALVMMLLENSGSIMQQAIVEVFDNFTQYYSENRCHVEGWKTNSQWKVNRKVILPFYIEWSYGGHFNPNYRRIDQFRDIDRVMAYIAGKNYETIDRLEDAIRKVKVGDSGKHESEFFWFRCYKKNTLHIEFKDKYLYDEFNRRACEGKQWLGN